MNSYNDLYSKIYDWSNLYNAYILARKGKRNKTSALKYEMNLEENLIILQNQLIYKMFKVGKYRTFTIYEPKERTIMALPFNDRVCQHAMISQIEPIFESTFFDNSFACRVGKGHIAAAEKLKEYLIDFTPDDFYLKCDVKKYFYSIDHAILKSFLKKKIACRDTMGLFTGIIDSTPDGVGLPIGNLTSQLCANIYLNELDKFIKHILKAKYYIRYMDDFILLNKNKEILKLWRAAIEEFLQNKLKLKLNSKTQINKIQRGISFLGYRNFKYYRVMQKRNWQVNKRKFKLFAREVQEGKTDNSKLKRSYASFQGYAKWCNSYKKVLKIDQIINNQNINQQCIKIN